MRAKSITLLALALGCGLVASIGITQVMAKRDKGPTLPSGDTQTIFVAVEDIPLGDPVTSQVLRLEQWPKDKMPAGALTKIEDVEGRRARSKIYMGEPILDNKLFPKGTSGQGASPLIPKGYRVVPVKVDTEKGGAGLILPGDRVDVAVYVSRVPGYRAGIHTVLQDIKVFAVNDVVDLESKDGDGHSIAAKTISLLVTPSQAHKLMLAMELGKVRLVMRSPEDDERVEDVSVSPREVFGTIDAANREKETLLPPQPEPSSDQSAGFLAFLKHARESKAHQQPTQPDQDHRHEMRIMHGPTVDVVVLEMEEGPSQAASGSGFWKRGLLRSMFPSREAGTGPLPSAAADGQGPQDAAGPAPDEPMEEPPNAGPGESAEISDDS